MNGGIFQPNIFEWLWGPGVGTNIGASIVWVVLAGAAAAVLWPPIRRRIQRFADRKLGAIHSHLVALRAHAEHQTRIAEDHFEASTGAPHPHAGRLDHVKMGADRE